MATSAEITAAAQAARDATEAFYDAAIAGVEADADFWKTSVTSPMASMSASTAEAAVADAMAALDELGIEVS